MIFAVVFQFHVYLPWVNTCLAHCFNSVLNVKVLVGTFNQEKAQVRDLLRISVVVKSS